MQFKSFLSNIYVNPSPKVLKNQFSFLILVETQYQNYNF